jgi:hypothetical protein
MMTANLPSVTQASYLTTLSNAIAAFRGEIATYPAANAVVEALLQAEKVAKQQRLNYPFEPLIGSWRLCFATGTRKARQRGGILLGRGRYVPKVAIAQISFSAPSLETQPNQGEIGNQAQLGSIQVKFTGPCKYLGKKNLLAFNFTQMQISLFGRTIYRGRFGKESGEEFCDRPISKLPFFAFFLVTDDFIAARGRGGGLALWIRDLKNRDAVPQRPN